MAKYCKNCGKELSDGVEFCTSCGEKVEKSTKTNDRPKVAKRELVVAILLSLFTCGIYNIYWFIVLTDDVNNLSQEEDTSGIVAFLLTLVTCGIYGIYWNYRMGNKLYKIGQKYNESIADNGILYLILSIVGLSIVSNALMQNDLNKFAE